MKKKVIGLFSVIFVTVIAMSLSVFYASAETVAEGTCGDSVTWVLDDSGVLTISGTGEMTEFGNYQYTPWSDYRENITNAVIEDGVTGVGSHSFNMCRALTSVSLPDSVTAIGKSAFSNCWSLTELALPEKLVSIGDSAFSSSNIVSLEFPATLESVGDLSTQKIESYSVAAENPYFSSENGILYNKDKSTLVAYPTAMKNTSFTIPDSVTVISDHAFDSNKNLKSVEIGNGVKTIERYAFFSTNIETIDFGDSIERIEYGAFAYCESLKEVHLPDSVTYIGGHAFYPCYSITEITLPNSELYIGSRAFLSDELTSVFIPEKVKTIESNPFEDCIKLAEIIVDENNAAFSSVDGVLYDKNQTLLIAYPAGKTDAAFDIPQAVQSISGYSFNGVCYLKEVIVPDAVTALNGHAFSGAESLENVYLPDTLESIGSGAFSDCKALKAIRLPKELKYLNSQAFYNCISLKSLIIPEKVQYVDYGLFQGCTGLEEVIFLGADCRIYTRTEKTPLNPVIKGYKGSTAEAYAEEMNYTFLPITAADYFGDDLFWLLDENGGLGVSGNGAMPEFDSADKIPWYEYKNDILSVSVGEGITSVGNYAFYQCAALESAELADSVRTIGDFAFFDCAALVRVGTGSGSRLAAIGSNVFGGCGALEEITIPKGVGAIGANPFLRCTSLKNINVNENNNTYYSADGVLFEKRGDKTVLLCYPAARAEEKYTVDDSITAIAPCAFAYCGYIEQIKLGTGSALEEIGQAAFYECSALSSFTVPPNVTQIDGNVFVMCFKLEAIYVHPLNNSFFAFDGVLFDYDMTRLITYPAGSEMTEYEVPFSVTTIESEAFCHCPYLETIFFEEGSELTLIKDSAFYNSEKLSHIFLPDALETIEAYAFMNCRSLGSVYIPENVTTIGSLAFAGCDSLTAIVILSRDCQTGKLYDAFVPATAYAYEDASFVPDLLLTAQVKYLADVPEGTFSFDGGILTINDITGVEGSEDPFVYPWTRWAGVTAVIQFNNSGTVATGLFSDFSLVSTIILNGADIALEENACTGLVSLKTVVSFADTSLEDGALGGVGEYNLFIEEGRNYEGSRSEMRFSFSDGTVSFISPSLSLCDYDFLDLITAVCYGYRNSTVSVIEFSFLEAVGFAFDSDFIIEEDEEVRTVYENIRIVPQVSYDAEQFEQISFNEFCENAANGEWVLLRLVTLDDSTDAPDEETSIQVTFSEVMNYILQAIIGFFNKILRLFKK